jgi:hypothetical protein
MTKRHYGQTLLIAALLLLLPTPAHPCQCGYIGSVAEEHTRAAAVFEGRVERISRLEPWWQYTRRNAADAFVSWLGVEMSSDWFEAERERLREQDGYGLVVTFRVISSSKGVIGKTVDVRTGLWMGDCGYRFETGELYRVIAYKRSWSRDLVKATGLETNRCTRTSGISSRDERFRSNDLFALAYPMIWTPIILAGMTGLVLGWLAQRLPLRRLAQDVVAWLAADLCGVVAFGVLFPVFAEGGMFAESTIIAQSMIATGRTRWAESLTQTALLFACCLVLSAALRLAARSRLTIGIARNHGLVCGLLGGASAVALPILIHSLTGTP